MNRSQDYIVPPKQWIEIANVANDLRKRFGLSKDPYFDVMRFIEIVLDQQMGFVRFEVGNREEMNGAEGFTCPSGEFIQLREDVYKGACNGEARHRFTAAHDLGHFLMHTKIPLARAKLNHRIPPYRLAEPQANHFAAEILMPRCFIASNDDRHSISERHGVSLEAAGNRLKYLRRHEKPSGKEAQVAA